MPEPGYSVRIQKWLSIHCSGQKPCPGNRIAAHIQDAAIVGVGIEAEGALVGNSGALHFLGVFVVDAHLDRVGTGDLADVVGAAPDGVLVEVGIGSGER